MAGPVSLSKLAQELGISPRKWLGLPARVKPRGISQRKVDNYIDNLQQVRGAAGYAKEISRDRRTIRSVKRITREITTSARPSQIARELGISYQKWTPIRLKIEAGEVYGPELRESLKQVKTGVLPEHEVRESPNGSKYDYFQNENTLEKIKIRWWKKVTPRGFDTLDQAAEWWERIGGGADYFAIASSASKRTGRKIYNVYDIRTAGEIKNKGKLRNMIRAREIIREEYE
jgi:hypothetical protein